MSAKHHQRFHAVLLPTTTQAAPLVGSTHLFDLATNLNQLLLVLQQGFTLHHGRLALPHVGRLCLQLRLEQLQRPQRVRLVWAVCGPRPAAQGNAHGQSLQGSKCSGGGMHGKTAARCSELMCACNEVGSGFEAVGEGSLHAITAGQQGGAVTSTSVTDLHCDFTSPW